MPNILETIVAYKRQLISNTPDFDELSLSQGGFKAALSQPQFGFIMEVKKASPSKGLIRSDFDLTEISKVYDQYADAISVLTEDRFFQGSFSKLAQVRAATSKPILCKDFILLPKQVRQARHYGADAVLLMMSVLSDHEYMLCAAEAKRLNMDVLTEVHDNQELKRAVALDAEIIGINNRNLKNLQTSLSITKLMSALVPQDKIIVTESGINNHQDVLSLAPFADACLVGSSLMAQQDLATAAKQLVYGDIKICGVTNQEDADIVATNPSSSLGIIFAESSKRKIHTEVIKAKLPIVGVFQNQSQEFVLDKVQQYQLQQVQLHGDESQAYISELKQQLDPAIKVSKVIHMNRKSILLDYQGVDELLLDSQVGKQQGGTGTRFDWELLQSPQYQSQQSQIRVAGGVAADNVQLLKQLGYAKIDICSGSELKVGIKSKDKIEMIFKNAKVLARSYQKLRVA
ncbi:bifunctional indole-3-glycerol-phosphate synthase TrpC/phosphoribosylanthranilate isomerase TrpF [Kangiella sp. TOML190]|uniref:bifunctional indole-3-glycerol-phosphate synthase TrpC/phosphoribosylanthranilate isomerase TrpF n=1 Tax=Kangiella sp. TOML190 TaxID=2931351 RepID=UPI00203B0C88|nr:bifunctional indole-3-glycerol-phosphate synthase TrpC/phosphoribosylanthranilate isomerase TrpF [Kangiella sp. TOML190]